MPVIVRPRRKDNSQNYGVFRTKTGNESFGSRFLMIRVGMLMFSVKCCGMPFPWQRVGRVGCGCW